MMLEFRELVFSPQTTKTCQMSDCQQQRPRMSPTMLLTGLLDSSEINLVDLAAAAGRQCVEHPSRLPAAR